MCLQLFEKEKEAKLALKAQYLEMLETGIYKIKFGVRPEDVFVVDGNIPKEANPSNELSSLVKITELLGNEYFVHVDILGKDFIFKTGTTASVNEGSDVKVVLDTNKIHIFDVLDSKVIF
ncbi:MAG: TOBE domain-containing protein [Bacilli bacterium]|nr:TOBE domain-containing protein [Bacilli bacterium]